MTTHRHVCVIALCVLAASAGCQKLAFWKKGHTRSNAQTTSLWNRDSAGPTKEQKRNFTLEMANLFESQGDVDQAIRAYEAVLEEKQNAQAQHRLGVLWVRKGDTDKAVAYFQKAIDVGGENAEVLCDLGYGLYVARRYDEAGAALKSALELDPKLRRAHINQGMLLARTGQYDEALWAFSRAGLSESEARNNLAFAMLVDQRFPEAQAQYEGALRADPQNATAQRGLAALSRAQQQLVPAGNPSRLETLNAGAPQSPSGVAPASYSVR